MSPLFPSYIFVRFAVETMFAKVNYTRGVQKVIGFGECATPVDDAVVALIRSRTQEDGFVHLTEPHVGETVHVVDGPLETLEGVFQRQLGGRDRVLIPLTTIRSQIRIQVPKACIRATRGFTAA